MGRELWWPLLHCPEILPMCFLVPISFFWQRASTCFPPIGVGDASVDPRKHYFCVFRGSNYTEAVGFIIGRHLIWYFSAFYGWALAPMVVNVWWFPYSFLKITKLPPGSAKLGTPFIPYVFSRDFCYRCFEL